GVGCAPTYPVDTERGAIAYAEGRDQPGAKSRLCVKGRYGWGYAAPPQRLATPPIRPEAAHPPGPLAAPGPAGRNGPPGAERRRATDGRGARKASGGAGAGPAAWWTMPRCCRTSGRRPGKRRWSWSPGG